MEISQNYVIHSYWKQLCDCYITVLNQHGLSHFHLCDYNRVGSSWGNFRKSLVGQSGTLSNGQLGCENLYLARYPLHVKTGEWTAGQSCRSRISAWIFSCSHITRSYHRINFSRTTLFSSRPFRPAPFPWKWPSGSIQFTRLSICLPLTRAAHFIRWTLNIPRTSFE